ncbi:MULTISPECIES: hypothetical protein [unclassified Streptomyces]|nr:hypothetical protein OG533_27605 [Streptomyces sp. NBC_01186]WSS44074.1 hypothetical protein OG220_28410 [Streptomyces sp. NBC_01187]
MCSTCNGTTLVPQPDNPQELTICPDCSHGTDPRDSYAADFDHG